MGAPWISPHRRLHRGRYGNGQSPQVFDLARDELPYDEEFLLAALLHDVGKAIDPHEHVLTGLEALDGFITERGCRSDRSSRATH